MWGGHSARRRPSGRRRRAALAVTRWKRVRGPKKAAPPRSFLSVLAGLPSGKLLRPVFTWCGRRVGLRDQFQGRVRQVPLRASILVVSPDAAPEVAFGGVALAAVVLIALGLHGHELKVPPSDASVAPRQQHST